MLNATLRQFEVFVTVAQRGSFGAAAARLDIAQTSVSAHIQSLEDQFGVELFVRRAGRRCVLTEAGTALLDHAETVLAEIASFRRHLAKTGRARVSFACQRSLAHTVLPPLVARFALEHPGIELVTRVGSQEEVMAQHQQCEADAACFVSNATADEPATRVIGHERYVIVADPQHVLAGRAPIDAAELATCRFVGPPDQSKFGQSLTRMLNEAGICRPDIVSRATEYAMMANLVMAGVGIACSAARNVAGDVAAGRLVILPLAGPPLHLSVRLLLPPTPSAPTRLFIAQLEQCWARPVLA